MDREYGEFVGVDNVHAAIITEDSETAYRTEPPEYFAPVGEIAGEPEIENTATYYDNAPGFNYVTEGVTVLTMVISGIPAQKAAKYLGKHYDPASGRVLDTGNPVPPDVALSFRYNKGSDGYRYYQYLKGTFSGGKEEASSKSSGKVDVKTYTMTYTAVVTSHKWEVNGELQGLKRIFADTTDPAFKPAGWFTSVQTPDTAAKPDAIVLVTSAPAAAATAVPTDAKIILSFNNEIQEEGIVLINAANGEPAKNTKFLDATGKILTITPTAPLAASTKYVAVITNVQDIFGQKLENSTLLFTTA